QLSLNPQKLAGQCGKLKCCLNYELDAYLDALKGFPSQEIRLKTQKGDAVCQKVDIFKQMMWYAYEGEWANWYVLTTDQVKEIIELHKEKQTVAGLEDYAVDLSEDTKTSFENIVGQDSLTRFDRPKGKKKRTQNKKRQSNNKSKRPKNAK